MAIVESRIREVTVFHSGALVVREARVSAIGGALPAEIEIPYLPLSLFDPTVRVRIEQVDGEADAWASQVRVGLYARPPDSVPSPPADEDVKKARRTVRRLDRAIARIEQEVSLLSDVEVPSRPTGEEGKPPPASPMVARVALEQFCDDGVQRRIAELRRLREERQRAAEELVAVEDALQRASTAKRIKADELSKVIVARLAQGPGTISGARIVVEYLVPGARWAPAYQCHLLEDSSGAELRMRALVTQHTGEDWRDARLRLSTASPLRYSELPDLAAIKIGRAQAPSTSRRGFRPPPRGAQSLFSDHDRDLHQARALLPSATGWQAKDAGLHPLASPAPSLGVARPKAKPVRAPPPPPSPSAALASAPPSRNLHYGVAAKAPPRSELAEADGGDRTSVGMATSEEGEEYLLDDDGGFNESTPAYELAGAPSAEVTMEVRALRRAKERAAPGAAVLETVAFTHLHLGDPWNLAERGRLTPLAVRATYLETLLRVGLEVTIDVLSVVDEASRRAAQTLSMPLPPDAADVRRASGSFDFIYETEHGVDVESDLAWHSIPVCTESAEADVRYVVVPREDTSVFRVVTLENPLDGPLLPGPAEVYVGGEYVLTTQLPTVAPRAELRLGLGVEQAIKCARNARFSEARSGDKRVAMTELRHGIEIELVNHTRRQARIEVRERIPQPAPEAEVVVDEESVDPPWQPFTQEEQGQPIDGGRCWSLALDAGARRVLRAGYVVRLYANNELVGGNRREA